jgi:hypothetical protein
MACLAKNMGAAKIQRELRERGLRPKYDESRNYKSMVYNVERWVNKC